MSAIASEGNDLLRSSSALVMLPSLLSASSLARVSVLSFAGSTKAIRVASKLILIFAKLCKIVGLATEIIQLGRTH